jgi:nitroimidazol reductase NimA-like FMN-containing flavoprotein (pyridoxamine 5'-phosphate oxidase superfamily)
VSIPTPPPERRRTRDRAVVVDRVECLSLLEQQRVGRLGFVVDGWPVVLPMNYLVDGGDIVLRTDAGTKLSTLRHGAQVSLQVDSYDHVYRSGWSVLVFGFATEMIDDAAISQARSLGLHSWAGGDDNFWIRIRPLQITGRRLPKAWQYPDPVGES